MDILKGINHKRLYAFLQKTDEEFLDFLVELKLLSARKQCPRCGREMIRRLKAKTWIWGCSYGCDPKNPNNKKTIGYFVGTFFEGSHLTPKEVSIY